MKRGINVAVYLDADETALVSQACKVKKRPFCGRTLRFYMVEWARKVVEGVKVVE